jgi:predicted GNAT superfamily acetyltransferase
LKEGSKIDAVKIESESGEYLLKMWAKATITNMIGNGSYFMVTFDNDLTRSNRDFPIYSSEIARYNTMSSDD